jgi:type IV secretion system protein VirD4
VLRSGPQPRKALSLGSAPPPPPGESCDVRDILAATADEQDDGFNAMTVVLRDAPGLKAKQAAETLDVLNRAFGDDQNP